MPWMIDLSGELSHVKKNGSITASLTPRNSGSVPVNLPKTSLKKSVRPPPKMCFWWNFEGVIHWTFVPNRRTVEVDLYSQQVERVHVILKRRHPAVVNKNSSFVAGQCETPYCTNNHDKNSGVERNRIAATPSIHS